MAIALGVILFASGAYFMYRAWSGGEEEENDESSISRVD